MLRKCCLLKALQNATFRRRGLEKTEITQCGVWLMRLGGRHCKTQRLADTACKPHCRTHCSANASLRQYCKTRCLSDAACWNHRKTVRSAHVGCKNHSDLVSARMCVAAKNRKPGQQTGRSTASKANVMKPPATQQTQNSADHAESNVPRLAHHISKHSVWQMQPIGNIVKQRVWRMRLAGDMQKHSVTRMWLAGDIAKFDVSARTG